MPETRPEFPQETRLFIDADACPVKAEAERVALRLGIRMFVVSNGGIRPRPHPLIESVFVADGPDVARFGRDQAELPRSCHLPLRPPAPAG